MPRGTIPAVRLAIDLLTDVLATRRVVRLVVDDEITRPVREKAYRVHPKLAYLVDCRACVSVWAAGAVIVSPRIVRRGLALSEASILVAGVGDLLE